MNGYSDRCNCARCRSRGIMGPAVLITVGILFLLNQYWHYGFQWPVLLIVIGLIKVWQSTTSTEGHSSGMMAPPATSVAQVEPPPGQVNHG